MKFNFYSTRGRVAPALEDAPRRGKLARISHIRPDEVAHALVRAVSRLLSTPWWGTDRAVGTGRRHECRRGPHECVRHFVSTECP